MTDNQTARERLLDLISRAEAANEGTTPEDAVADAISEALLNQPSLRHCLVPGCMREYDVISCMNGNPPPRESWSGKGWATLGCGSIFPAGGNICPDHKDLVTAHFPLRVKLPNGRWTVQCACNWTPGPRRWHGVLRSLWEEHLLTETGTLPPAPPITDPEHRLPLAEHTADTLTELYDRLWDAESDQKETREAAQAMYKSWDWHRHTLGGAARAVVSVCNMMRVASSHYERDWTGDRHDAYLWAVLIGFDDDTLAEIAAKHRWDEHRVKYAREMRALLAPITDPQPKEPAT